MRIADIRRNDTGRKGMKSEREELRVCRRCLTRELTDAQEIFQSMRDYIENLDVDIRTPEEAYEARLAVCKACDMLLQGMCRKCGCYVELRAAVRGNACPDELWGGEDEERL